MTKDEVRWLNPEERHTWLMLGALLQSLPAQIDGQLRHDGGVNHFEYSILAGLSQTGGKRALAELSVFAGGSASRMSHAVSRLEKRGWVQRVHPPEGGRNLDLQLTDGGRAALDAIAPGHVTQVRRSIFDALTPRQVRQLGDLSAVLLRNCDPQMHDMMASEDEAG